MVEAELARFRAYVATVFLSTKQVAARYDVTPRTIQRWLKLGHFPAPKSFPGRCWPLADLLAAEAGGQLPRVAG